MSLAMGQNGTDASQAEAIPVIEQKTARNLLRIYQVRRAGEGIYGPTRITKDIYECVGKSLQSTLSQHDIKHWLSGRTKQLRDDKFRLVNSFITSKKFRNAVSQTESIFGSLGRPIESGREGMLSHLDGLWLISRASLGKDVEPGNELTELFRYDKKVLRDYPKPIPTPERKRLLTRIYLPSFMHLKWVSEHNFSVVHLMNGCSLSEYQTPGLYASGILTLAEDGRLVARLKDRNDPHSESQYFLEDFDDFLTARSSKREAFQWGNRLVLDSPSERHFLSYMNESLLDAYRCSPSIDLTTKQGPLRDEDKELLNLVQKKFDAFSWGVISQEGE